MFQALRVRAISDLKEELRKFAAAEKRWKSQVSAAERENILCDLTFGILCK